MVENNSLVCSYLHANLGKQIGLMQEANEWDERVALMRLPMNLSKKDMVSCFDEEFCDFALNGHDKLL